MFKEYENNNQLNNIKSMTCMVNDAVQTSDDMRNLIVCIKQLISTIYYIFRKYPLFNK